MLNFSVSPCFRFFRLEFLLPIPSAFHEILQSCSVSLWSLTIEYSDLQWLITLLAVYKYSNAPLMFIKTLLHFYFVLMCAHAYIFAIAQLWRSEGSLRELVFSFHCGSPEDYTWGSSLVESSFTHRTISLDQCVTIIQCSNPPLQCLFTLNDLLVHFHSSIYLFLLLQLLLLLLL